MKRLSLLTSLFLLLLFQAATAQKTFKKAFSAASGSQKLNILVDRSQMQISGISGNELIIEATAELPKVPERAKGLKPLYNGATDNTGLGLEVEELGGVMTLKKATFSNIAYTIKVPAGADIKIEETGWNGGDFALRDLSGEIEIECQGSSVKMENVTGPVVANSVNGNIEVVFSKINQQKPTDISATNGYVDVTMPADTKANIELTSINGQPYSDFEIKADEENSSSAHVTNTTGTINGGGVEISLNTINNHIYLRKK